MCHLYRGDTEILFYDNEKKPTRKHIKEVESYISYKEHFPYDRGFHVG